MLFSDTIKKFYPKYVKADGKFWKAFRDIKTYHPYFSLTEKTRAFDLRVPVLRFVYEGGRLDNEELEQIKTKLNELPGIEITHWELLVWDEYEIEVEFVYNILKFSTFIKNLEYPSPERLPMDEDLYLMYRERKGVAPYLVGHNTEKQFESYRLATKELVDKINQGWKTWDKATLDSELNLTTIRILVGVGAMPTNGDFDSSDVVKSYHWVFSRQLDSDFFLRCVRELESLEILEGRVFALEQGEAFSEIYLTTPDALPKPKVEPKRKSTPRKDVKVLNFPSK